MEKTVCSEIPWRNGSVPSSRKGDTCIDGFGSIATQSLQSHVSPNPP